MNKYKIKCRRKLVKCTETTGPPAKLPNTTDSILHGGSLASNKQYTTAGSVVIVEVKDISASEPSKSRSLTSEKEIDLKTQVQSLNKYQLLDLLHILSKKLKRIDRNFSFIEVIGRCVKRTSENKNPVTLNIRDLYTEEEIDCDDIANKITTYTSKGNFVFKKVTLNSSQIWEATEPNQYGIIVEYNKQDRFIKIFKLNGTSERVTFQVEPAEIGNLFTLNISYKVSTSKYSYSRKVDSDIFTVFDPFLIYKVKRGDEVLFSCNDKVYAFQVVVGSLNNGKRNVACRYRLKPNNVIMVKSIIIDCEGPKEGADTVEQEYISGKDDDDDDFNDSTNSDSHEHDDHVDEYDENEDEDHDKGDHGKRASQDLNDSSSDDEETIPDGMIIKDLKLIGLNLNGTESVLDRSKFIVKRHVINKDILVFQFKRNVLCSRVKHNDTDVWFADTKSEICHDDDCYELVGSDISITEKDDVKRSTGTQTKGSFDDTWIHKYPVSVAYDTNALVIWVVFWTTYLEYLCIDGMWLQKVEAPPDLPGAIEKRGIEIYTLGEGRKLRENDDTMYELTRTGMQTSTLMFTFKEGSKCLLIKHGGLKIWLISDKSTPVVNNAKEYPAKVVYHVQAKTIFIMFRNTYLGYVFMKNKWELKVNKPIQDKPKKENAPSMMRVIYQRLRELTSNQDVKIVDKRMGVMSQQIMQIPAHRNIVIVEAVETPTHSHQIQVSHQECQKVTARELSLLPWSR
ncbi:hypothetical protein MACK_000036 [Theileria orientalis]|uniref:Uncharacterized protein n=1 Tax=Theileria orientalis TaxID=68886 RepID=A0A976QU09_THEOR|nr:hypothetical protein MACK_000036 [Theileria orientalis]